MKTGGVILCGGKSTRMGQSKAMLPFGDEHMLQRVVRIVAGEVDHIVVAAAQDQELPELPSETIVVRDQQSDAGPLQGIATGLSALKGVADAAFITSCDVPLLRPEVIQLLFAKMGQHDIVVPQDDKFSHVLCAVYRTEVAAVAKSLLANDQRRPIFLFDECETVKVPVDEIRNVDPQLHSLMNLNRLEDYEQALRHAGLK